MEPARLAKVPGRAEEWDVVVEGVEWVALVPGQKECVCAPTVVKP